LSWHDLSGRVALVVGASRGLGRESALALARGGADIALAARSPEAVARVGGEVGALGRRAVPLTLDVADEGEIARAVDAVPERLGRLDVLVFAAGLQLAAASAATSTADWERLLRTNLTGAFLTARQAFPHLKQRGGRIIFFGTSFVDRVLPHTVAYNVSKGGLHQLVHTLAVEWARHQITVNAIAPGFFETDMPRAVLDNPDLRQRTLARIPLRRFGQPAEIGPLVHYLASEASGFMTGAILRIDGGQSLNVA
jgi:2-deoxy-D-gluconate 3-dehydrogenase